MCSSDLFLFNTQRLGTDGRLTMLSASPGGCEWHLMCGTKETASEAREIFIEAGIHMGHVKVARLSACQAKVAERERSIQERLTALRSDLEVTG